MTAQIVPLGDPARHFWITRSMARTLDVNLTEAMSQNALTADDYGAMVTRCRMCRHVEGCMLWLGRHGPGAKDAPEFCANAGILNRLAGQ